MVWIKQERGFRGEGRWDVTPAVPFFQGWGRCCGHFQAPPAPASLQLQPFPPSSAGQARVQVGDALKDDPFEEKQLQLPRGARTHPCKFG